MTGGVLALALLAFGGVLAFCLGVMPWTSRPSVLFALSLTVLLGAAGAEVAAPSRAPELFGLLDLGGFTRFFAVLSCLLSALTLLFLHPYAARRGLAGEELYGLLPLACLGMVLAAGATHWLSFFVGYELQALCLYVMVPWPRWGRPSAEAGAKFFFLGAAASAFLVFGVALLYAATGTLGIAESLGRSLGGPPRPWVLLALAFVVVGVGVKLAAVPFHLWAADVYQGAALPVAGLLATAAKVSVFAMVLRAVAGASPQVQDAVLSALGPVAVLSVVVGSVGALAQPSLKRLLAYSSVAQVGYLLLALVGAGRGGAEAALFYAVAYGVADLGAFALLGSLSPQGGDLDPLEELRGLGYACPWRAASLVACLASLAGLPPSGGFLGKLGVFTAVFRAGHTAAGLAALAATVPAGYLYLRLAASLYRVPEDRAPAGAPPAHPAEVAAAAASALVAVGLGLAPQPLAAAVRAAASLVAG